MPNQSQLEENEKHRAILERAALALWGIDIGLPEGQRSLSPEEMRELHTALVASGQLDPEPEFMNRYTVSAPRRITNTLERSFVTENPTGGLVAMLTTVIVHDGVRPYGFTRVEPTPATPRSAFYRFMEAMGTPDGKTYLELELSPVRAPLFLQELQNKMIED